MSLPGFDIDPEALASLSEGERAFFSEQLAHVQRAYRDNPLLGYRPHAKQVAFHRGPWPRTRLFLGGNRSGKTTATFVDTCLQAVDAELVPEHLRVFRRWEPPFFCRIVGPGLTRWLEGVALQKFREWLPRGQLEGGGFARGWDKQQLMLRFKNGSWIQLMSNDQDLDQFAGVALHRVVYDEPPREDIWGECRARLIDYGGEELFGLTPTEGMSNWLYDKWYAPWEQLSQDEVSPGEIEERLRARLVLVDMDDNPHLSEEDKEWALEGWASSEREARKTGRFVSMSGLVYPQFPGHVVPEEDSLPEGVEVFAGIDPGIRHMMAVVFCYLDSSDRMVVFDEIAVKDKTIKSVCELIHAKSARWGVRPAWFVIDPASKNRNNQTGRSDQAEFADHGVLAGPGQTNVDIGINKVRERLEADKLFVAANCAELLSEFKKYRWARDTSRSEDEAPTRPVKKDDHLLDALRYVVMQRPLVPTRRVEPGHRSFKERALEAALKRLDRRPSARVPDNGFGPGVFQ